MILDFDPLLSFYPTWVFMFTAASVERPHNDVHVALGYPMNQVCSYMLCCYFFFNNFGWKINSFTLRYSQVNFAAFTPEFYLHHCNIDRIHEAFLQQSVYLGSAVV